MHMKKIIFRVSLFFVCNIMLTTVIYASKSNMSASEWMDRCRNTLINIELVKALKQQYADAGCNLKGLQKLLAPSTLKGSDCWQLKKDIEALENNNNDSTELIRLRHKELVKNIDPLKELKQEKEYKVFKDALQLLFLIESEYKHNNCASSGMNVIRGLLGGNAMCQQIETDIKKCQKFIKDEKDTSELVGRDCLYKKYNTIDTSDFESYFTNQVYQEFEKECTVLFAMKKYIQSLSQTTQKDTPEYHQIRKDYEQFAQSIFNELRQTLDKTDEFFFDSEDEEEKNKLKQD